MALRRDASCGGVVAGAAVGKDIGRRRDGRPAGHCAASDNDPRHARRAGFGTQKAETGGGRLSRRAAT